ncbi:MAG TPA: phosphoribosylanthranilate isomerase [Rudaea sp.]|jgi:phosphoribosylanthranilate isomerase|nr:phosphoribosylanthranilate isomerase [Rudaea sp.]
MTRLDDAQTAVSLGADAVGFLLTKKSKRFIEPARARVIRETLPAFVTAVVLFNNDGADWIGEAIRVVQPDIIQFHGTESRELCESFGVRYVKTIGMGEEGDVERTIAEHPNAVAYLLDSNKPGEQGGSGVTFDWSRIPTNLSKAVILAGGLTCDNVELAIRTARPYAVDVASGIESAPGIKDAEKMRRFINEVRRASGDS